MNKYQEALDTIVRVVRDDDGKVISISYGGYAIGNQKMLEQATKNLSLLQELVDRATPKKVVCNHEQGEYEYNGSKHPYNDNIFRCPKCESRLLRQDLDDKNVPPLEERIFPFCKKCGQALEWQKEGK